MFQWALNARKTSIDGNEIEMLRRSRVHDQDHESQFVSVLFHATHLRIIAILCPAALLCAQYRRIQCDRIEARNIFLWILRWNWALSETIKSGMRYKNRSIGAVGLFSVPKFTWNMHNHNLLNTSSRSSLLFKFLDHFFFFFRYWLITVKRKLLREFTWVRSL